MNSTSELDATYYGFIGSTYDALILFEACIAGQIKHVSRRPHDRERECVIRSGRIFIYEESTSGIKRWTDGIYWSPSRILGNFLIYRQLVKAFGPGEKKKAIKKSKPGPSGITKNTSDNNSSSRNKENRFHGLGNFQVTGSNYGRAGAINAETQRALIGSLTDSYDFLEDGLVKKTISVTFASVTHHLVSYYTIADAISQKFIVPSQDPRFAHTHPRASLLTLQNFRTSVEGMDPMDRLTYPPNRFETTNQNLVQRQIPMMPALGNHYSYSGTATNMYSSNCVMTVSSTTYELDSPANKSTVGYQSRYAPASGTCSAPRKPDHHQGDYRQHSVVPSSSGSDGCCVPITPAIDLQRQSPFFHWRGSGDSGISMPMDNIMNDATFRRNRNSVYGISRDMTLTANCIAAQKTLLSSSQAKFACQISCEGSPSEGQNYCITTSSDNTDNWRMGNASAGHGHYQIEQETQASDQTTTGCYPRD